MRERGYLLFDICELQRKSDDRALAYLDVLFIKEESFIRNQVNY